MIAVGFENDDETDECSSNKSFKPLVIKYSDFLTACIDERRVLTKEKVIKNIKVLVTFFVQIFWPLRIKLHHKGKYIRSICKTWKIIYRRKNWLNDIWNRSKSWLKN